MGIVTLTKKAGAAVAVQFQEAELEEIVKMVGMDALSPGDRLKMEAARSIREDFLHQNSFHEIDTYTSLKKTAYDDEAGHGIL